ncbi:latent-transforming growth factor beta-binding protein 4 [Amyelois transitella]|uniref:latent-transforming growth factor beta-binding protein 4 n=1 Tax=Amyelois transitella TaxID=680683 RepID=UPI00298F958E|nr:latent-transforming growth factor beta-binding protein 4 [Amyelois transitella]
MNVKIVLLVLCASLKSFGEGLTSEEEVDIKDTCCGHADLLAVSTKSVQECSSSDLPDFISPDEEGTCRAAMQSCCSKIFTLKDECTAGTKYAAEKRCSVPKTEIGKTCCEECSIGRWTGESQGVESCGAPASEGTPPNTALRRNTFYQCCVEAASQPTTTEKVVITTTEKKIETTTAKKEKCAKNSCDHVCNDEDGKIRCQCHEGYRLQGDKKSCKDINECAEALDDLCVAQDTVCHNTAGSFKCVPIKKREVGGCPPGFKKNIESQVCDDINECQHPRPPCPKYLCKNTIGGYTCAGKPGTPYVEESPKATTETNEATVPTPRNDICPPGFRAGPDDECIDIDECEERSDDCQHLSQHCINTHGHFFCQDHVSKRCTPGFVINPTTGKCEDINECEDITEVCKRTEVCINLPGAYNCKSKISTLPKLATKTCQEGTRIRPGGTICEDIDECREGTHLCDEFQNCINTFGGHECRCKNGFELDSSSGACVDIDECALKMDNCSPGTHCLNMLGTFTCTRRAPATTSTTTPSTIAPTPAPSEYDYEYYSEEDNSTDSTNEAVPPPPPTTTPRPTTPKPPTTTSTTTPRSTTESSARTPKYPYYYTPRTTTTSRSPYRPDRPMYTRPIYTTSTTTRRPHIPEERPRYPEYSYDPYGRPRRPEETTTELLRRPEDRPRPDYSRPNTYDRPRRPEESTTTEEIPKPYIPRRPEEPRRPEPSRPLDPFAKPRPDDFTTEEVPKPFIPRRPEETPSRPEDPREEIPKEPELGPKPDDDNRPGFDINSLHCLDGYEKNEHGDCVDTNECEANRHLCSNLEECENRPGGYTCECIRGFTRDPSGWCVAITTSSTTTSTTTERTTTPVPTTTPRRTRYPPRVRPTAPPPSRVNCDFGYNFDTSEGRCIDIDECATNKHTCAPNEDCINFGGGYNCECGRRCRGETDRQPNVYYPVSPTRETVPMATTPSSPTDSNIITVGAQFGQRGPRVMRPPYVRFNYGTMQPCPWGYKLTPDKRCLDIDECARNVSQCGPEQRCENFFGGYSCHCPGGHRLSGEDGCEDIDECRFGSPCSYNGECINTIGSYHCKCGDGFRNAPANDKVCMDIDECSEDPGVCDHECTNTWGGYRCYCRRGYRLDRDNKTCVDVDECSEWSAVRLRGRLCGGECVNEPGSFRCRCPAGYRLSDDGKSCVDIDECETGEASCAHSSTPGEVCQNTRGSYHCHRIDCPRGYRLESKHRCTRVQRACPISDWSCLQQPSAYSYNFITFVSNIFLPSGRVDLFTMHGPSWRDTLVTFEMRMIDVQASHGVKPADLRCFDMRPSNNVCVISLLCSLQGPQVAELELTMSLYQRDQFAGSAVARLVVIVSQYEF